MTTRPPDRINEDRERLLALAAQDAIRGGAQAPGAAGYTDAQFQAFQRALYDSLKSHQAAFIDQQTSHLRDALEQARASGSGVSEIGRASTALHLERKRLAKELGYQDWGWLENEGVQKVLGAIDLGARTGGVIADRALMHKISPYMAQQETARIIGELRTLPPTSEYAGAGTDFQQLITNIHDQLDRPDYYWGSLEAIADPIEFLPFGKGASLASRSVRSATEGARAASEAQARFFPQ